MTAQDINNSLYRPILNGSEFDYLMPAPTFKTVKLATGNTKVAINQMAKWAKQHAHQTKALAPELIGNTLQETLNNIQWFLYWHIHYSIDGNDQNLKTPANAWATRQEGTDCKSYTIFASTILLNLGIKHYLRRIKQEVQSDAFTHVYVVIPKNQTTGHLPKNAQFNTDYYIIDGTIEINNELPFTEKDDIYMESKLPIYGMAAGLNCGSDLSCGCTTAPQTLMATSLGYATTNQEEEALNQFADLLNYLESKGAPEEAIQQAINNLEYALKNNIQPTPENIFGLSGNYGLGLAPLAIAATSGLDFSGILSNLLGGLDLSGVFGKLSCIGGTYDSKDSKFFTNAMSEGASRVISNFNQAILAGNFQAATNAATNFLQAAAQIKSKADLTANKKWSSSCSTEAAKIFKEVATFYNDIAVKAFYPYLLKYFSFSESNISKSNSTLPSEFIIRVGDDGMKTVDFEAQVQVKQLSNLQPKLSRVVIPGFEFTEYLTSSIKTSGFNVGQFLNTLSQAIYEDPNAKSDSYVDANGNLVQTGNTQPQQAGMGVGMIVLLVGVAAGGVYLATKKK